MFVMFVNILVQYIMSGDSHRVMHYSNRTFRQRTWILMSVFSKLMDPFTKFYQKGKDDV